MSDNGGALAFNGAGNYTLTAIAVDTQGREFSSEPVSIHVIENLTISLTADAEKVREDETVKISLTVGLGTPSYELQGLTELHCYLKTVHQFEPAEVEALLQFADPLEAANLCWEENSHAYSFPICDLLRETEAKKLLPLAEPEPPKRQSVREQLRTAMKEARQQSGPEERAKGGDAR